MGLFSGFVIYVVFVVCVSTVARGVGWVEGVCVYAVDRGSERVLLPSVS
jgi:hypothetical protein